MNTQSLITSIEQILQQRFQPTQLNIIDESALHKGHPGAVSGRPHLAIIIRAQAFHGKNSLAIHRMIYQALDRIIKDSLHALRLDAAPSDH